MTVGTEHTAQVSALLRDAMQMLQHTMLALLKAQKCLQ